MAGTSEGARKAWTTRRSRQKKNSEAARKAWATRRGKYGKNGCKK